MTTFEHQYFANGKLLLTGEYFVLDEATAIALPCQYGQSLEVLPYQAGTIHWRSYDVDKQMWLETIINTSDWSIRHSNDDAAAVRLLQLLKAAKSLGTNKDLSAGYNIWTRLQFEREWGLGSSSTLISLVAQWTEVNPFQLGALTFGGSGYDIACATADGPIIYMRTEDAPIVQPIEYDPDFKEHCCFVHLGQKKDTQEALTRYASLKIKDKSDIQNSIGIINDRVLLAKDIESFCSAIDDHETIISDALKLPKVKEERFADFHGSVKSLGAWGGDFVLAASTKHVSKTITYFQTKGYDTILLWDDMVLNRV